MTGCTVSTSVREMCQDIGKTVDSRGKAKGREEAGPKALRSVVTKGFGPWRRDAPSSQSRKKTKQMERVVNQTA